MHSLQVLSAEILIERTETLAREEREKTVLLIEHLREIDRRKLYADLGYESLHDFCVRKLLLSAGSAQRRISSMFLMKDLPELKESLLSGEVSLSNAAKLSCAFRAEKKLAAEQSRAPMDVSAKREVFQEIAGLSQRECEAKLFSILPAAMHEQGREREKRVGNDASEIRILVDNAFLEKLSRLKELLSHSVPGGSTRDVFERLLDTELSRMEKKRGVPSEANMDLRSADDAPKVQPAESLSDTAPVRKPIPAFLRREVWKRANGTCEFPNCRSRHRLEIDHRIPIAQGGTNAFGNLRLLCRTHNESEARRILGRDVFEKYRKIRT